MMNEHAKRIQNAITATKELGKAGVIPENYYEDPCMPSKVKTEPGMHGKVVSVKEAIAMGLQTAKIV